MLVVDSPDSLQGKFLTDPTSRESVLGVGNTLDFFRDVTNGLLQTAERMQRAVVDVGILGACQVVQFYGNIRGRGV